LTKGEINMTNKRIVISAALLSAILVLLVGLAAVGAADDEYGPTPVEQLGKSIFFDDNLSIYRNQSCAACHTPPVGWTGPIAEINAAGAVYEGSITSRFGNRKPPSAAYATISPILHMDRSGLWIGGNFWNGRATGEKLGNPAADQAQGPFVNPAEQALSDSACVVYRVCNGDYSAAFVEIWGSEACNITWPADVEATCAAEGTEVALSVDDRARSDMAYDDIALSIAVYEASSEVNALPSKYDATFHGKVKLSKQEQRGYALFRGKAMCHRCHISNGQEALFTDFTFDNLGVPKNPENPVYDYDPGFVDFGLGGFLMDAGYPEEVYQGELGKQKVPTLRNVDLRPSEDFVKAYGHNGYFKSLESIVHFYNTRDVKPICPGDYTEAEALAAGCWPPPEVAENVNTDELGNLGLSPDEEAALVAYMKTLSDGFQP
jgi:cytochrome c peroxidase